MKPSTWGWDILRKFSLTNGQNLEKYLKTAITSNDKIGRNRYIEALRYIKASENILQVDYKHRDHFNGKCGKYPKYWVGESI